MNNSEIESYQSQLRTEDSAAELVERISEYLQLGGLINPELMEHDKVRDLLIAV